jgi:GDP-L-fucose synthase
VSRRVDLSGARVVVTGGAGFLGEPLCRRLSARGAHVLVPRRSDVDFTEQAATDAYIASVSADVVIHAAAEVGGIGANRDNPGRYFYANMAMGLNLIEATRRYDVQKFVQIGTVCSYPKFTPVPFREETLWDGYPEETNAPYGIAKKALLVMLQAYREQYGTASAYLMPVNLYGPRDNFDLVTSHVIPALIRKCEDARRAGDDEIVCWGTGSASREFLYVEDCAEAIALATERHDDPEPVNVGSGVEITIRDLVQKVADASGFDGSVIWDETKPDGQPRRKLETSRAQECFGFTSSTSFEDGLRTTVEWYRTQEPVPAIS